MSDTTATSVAPLVKTVTVPVDQQRAFDLFTVHIAEWWPLATHSVGRADATSVRLEGRVGGEITETIADGGTETWGTVTEWEPPTAVSFTWHPGHDAEHATRVSVRFRASDGDTSVELTHTGWAADASAMRTVYDSGWDVVLGRYVEGAGAAS